MKSLDCTPAPCGAFLRIKAKPGSRENSIRGVHDGALCVRVTAAPERGKANKAILELLAKKAGLPPSSLSVEAGDTASQKRILFRGISPDNLMRILAPLLDE